MHPFVRSEHDPWRVGRVPRDNSKSIAAATRECIEAMSQMLFKARIYCSPLHGETVPHGDLEVGPLKGLQPRGKRDR